MKRTKVKKTKKMKTKEKRFLVFLGANFEDIDRCTEDVKARFYHTSSAESAANMFVGEMNISAGNKLVVVSCEIIKKFNITSVASLEK